MATFSPQAADAGKGSFQLNLPGCPWAPERSLLTAGAGVQPGGAGRACPRPPDPGPWTAVITVLALPFPERAAASPSDDGPCRVWGPPSAEQRRPCAPSPHGGLGVGAPVPYRRAGGRPGAPPHPRTLSPPHSAPFSPKAGFTRVRPAASPRPRDRTEARQPPETQLVWDVGVVAPSGPHRAARRRPQRMSTQAPLG